MPNYCTVRAYVHGLIETCKSVIIVLLKLLTCVQSIVLKIVGKKIQHTIGINKHMFYECTSNFDGGIQ